MSSRKISYFGHRTFEFTHDCSADFDLIFTVLATFLVFFFFRLWGILPLQGRTSFILSYSPNSMSSSSAGLGSRAHNPAWRDAPLSLLRFSSFLPRWRGVKDTSNLTFFFILMIVYCFLRAHFGTAQRTNHFALRRRDFEASNIFRTALLFHHSCSSFE